ncbi:MAG: HDIG domain-containing protein [Candidatus Omnitrophica bacterium]|nr:HDIG domain-containing protein [Candidatus Omnitrophota bacterium]
MSPLIKKTLFRMKKLQRPLRTDEERKKHLITKGVRRGAIATLISLMIIGVIYSGKLPIRTILNEGDIAITDIYAPFDFSYNSGIDQESTQAKQDSAAEGVLDIYEVDTGPLEKAKAAAVAFFDRLISAKEAITEITDDYLNNLEKEIGLAVTTGDIRVLLDYPDIDSLKAKTLNILEKIYFKYIISDETKKSIIDSGKSEISIYQGPRKEIITESLDGLYNAKDPSKIIKPSLIKYEIEDNKIKAALNKALSGWVEPNLLFSSDKTESAKKEAVLSIEPIYIASERSEGETVIRKGQRVTKDHIIQLDEISRSQVQTDTYSQLSGILVIVSLLVFLMFIYLKFFEPKVFSQDKLLFLIGILIFLVAVSARIIVSSPLPSYFIPVASISMLLTLLVGGNVAAIVVIAAAVVVALIAGAKFNIFLVSMVGGISAICTIYKARKRNQIIRSGLYVGVLNFITICAMGIISNFELSIFIKEGLWGIGSGLTAAAITMLLLPAIESLFKITTDIKLLELSDLNHPLLKEMVTNATGTYHHSMVVGNLAEAAADAIGANPLLARVGSYYHDIGKIAKSEYFAENKQVPSDLHEKLSPSMSSLIITNHVKDAVELAEKHSLGNVIKDIIEQHHGTGLVTYFFHQAVEKTQDTEPVSEEAFRYPGPKPQTKESAIVMLADSVEATSRVLQNPTPQRLKELVRKIINNKFIDRQLDECELTLKDISKISDSFVKILTGIYHSRIEYPSKTTAKHGNNNSKRAKRGKA